MSDIVELASEEQDDSLLHDALEELDKLGRSLESLEFQRMFSGQMDSNNAYMEIQSAPVVQKLRIGQRCCSECIPLGREARVFI